MNINHRRAKIIALSFTAILGASLLGLAIFFGNDRGEKTGSEKPAFEHNPNARYNGITAREWGEELLDRGNNYRIIEANTALCNLRRDGVPYLVEAVRNGTVLAQYMSLQCLAQRPDDAAVFFEYLKPTLSWLCRVAEPDENLNYGLCEFLGSQKGKAKDFVEYLQRTEKTATKGTIQKAARKAIVAIEASR